MAAHTGAAAFFCEIADAAQQKRHVFGQVKWPTTWIEEGVFFLSSSHLQEWRLAKMGRIGEGVRAGQRCGNEAFVSEGG